MNRLIDRVFRSAEAVVIAGLFLAVGGCRTERKENAGAKETAPRTVSASGKVAALSPELSAVGAKAVAVLAKELKIDPKEISVDTVRPVEWRDSSMGCPQPDQAYMQVMTPGHKIALRRGKSLYFVHESKGRAFLCRRNKARTDITARRELVWGPQAIIARKDLAQRLGVDETKVKIAGAIRQKWPDTSLGCPKPNEKYKKEPVEGYLIRMMVGVRAYAYHTDLKRVFACPAITED
ncbi:MAG: hypothetical protein AAF449_21380 [Myxococcota bacterium]